MPSWTKEQQDAINKDGTNIIVSAGAGSGKTAVLTQRVITKLSKGINIDELLILTFTNLAAREMKDRIKKALLSIDDKKNLEKIDSSYITTFDSYALSIVKKYHYLLNINKSISIVDSNIIRIKEREIIDEIFENLYKNKNERIFAPGYEHLYRRLSVRECARIQSFPDSFRFIYTNIQDGYKMVGNAVPPRMARYLAEQLKIILNIK